MALNIAVAMGLNFASGFLKGIGESNAAKVEAANYAQQAVIYQRNAAVTRINGARNEDVMRSQNRAYLANAAATAGEAGMGESPTMVSQLATSGAALEQNVLNQRYQTESEAENYLYQARVAEENARQAKKKSKNKFINGLVSGASSALLLLNDK